MFQQRKFKEIKIKFTQGPEWTRGKLTTLLSILVFFILITTFSISCSVQRPSEASLSETSTEPATTTAGSQGFMEMSVDDVYSAIKGEEDYFILDVRTRDEFEAAHIGGAKLIPVSELENRLDEIPEGKPIIVYCRSGNRSAQAATILVQNGFKEVYNMRGGISAWISKGYPVVK